MKPRYLLDTNILSDLVRNPQGLVAQKISEAGEKSVCTSIIVASELRFGAKKLAQRAPPLGRDRGGLAAANVDDRTQKVVLGGVEPLVGQDVAQKHPLRDFKSALQELVQADSLPLPEYSVVAEDGPDHERVFHIQVGVGAKSASGQGRTKKRAEQRAGPAALLCLA